VRPDEDYSFELAVLIRGLSNFQFDMKRTMAKQNGERHK
jgi:hypothetical protein